MKQDCPVSVVIPTFNRALWLRECLDSVVHQTLPPREIIVVDDGSDDETERVCRRVLSEVIYLYQERRGVSAARNRGINAARSDWIAFLDSDDLWLPKKLMLQIDYLGRNPEVKVLQTEEIWLKNGRRVNPRRIHKKPSGWVFEKMIPLCLVSPSAVMIHRSVFDHVGLFDETLPACEDYDLWLRIALYYPIITLAEPLTIKRGGHEDQLSRQWGLDRYRIRALEKILNDEAISEEQKELVRCDISRRSHIFIQGRQKREKDADCNNYLKVCRAAKDQNPTLVE